MNKMFRIFYTIMALIFSLPAMADSLFVNAEDSYSPYVDKDLPTNVYWGDTHLHTNLSMDAYIRGNRLGPDEAYRFSKGEAVTTRNGVKARIYRPLDFLVLIRAVKDPDGANLDRVQVIKGWHDKKGELHEKIYNAALSDGRKEKRGKVKPVGSTVDVEQASYSNSIGDPELATVWKDPDFDKDELAFYYVRVLEIPTPRWTAYDAKFFGIKDVPEEVPMVTQERAYSSPIWYTPSGSNNPVVDR